MYTTTYSIEKLEFTASLSELRADIVRLGKELRHDLFMLANNYVKNGKKRPD